MNLHCPTDGGHTIEGVRPKPHPGELFCPQHGTPLRVPARRNSLRRRESAAEKAARQHFARVVCSEPCFFADRLPTGEPRRPGHHCRYPLDPHHILPKSPLRHELDLPEDELLRLVWNPLIGAPLCRAAHDAVTTRRDYIYRDELNPELVELCERFDTEHPEQRSLLERLWLECPER